MSMLNSYTLLDRIRLSLRFYFLTSSEIFYRRGAGKQRHASCFSLLPLFSLLAGNLHRLCNGSLIVSRGTQSYWFYSHCPRGRDQHSSPILYSVDAALDRDLMFLTTRTSRLCSCTPDRELYGFSGEFPSATQLSSRPAAFFRSRSSIVLRTSVFVSSLEPKNRVG
jgi:hypothetical protein